MTQEGILRETLIDPAQLCLPLAMFSKMRILCGGLMLAPVNQCRNAEVPMAQPSSIINLRKKDGEKNAPPPSSAAPPETDATMHRPSSEAKTFTWEAPEFVERPKEEKRWISIVVSIGVPLIALFLWLRNVLGAIVVVVGGSAFLVQAFRKPQNITFAVTDKGITAGKNHYPYEDLKSFWIFMEPPRERSLSVQRKKGLGHTLTFPLGTANPVALRATLLNYLPEEEQKPSEFDAWLRKIGY